MRIMHLAWEYPPVLYGGLGRHVHALANAQARNGHEVVVITQSPPSPLPDMDAGPVQVVRVGDDPAFARADRRDLLPWVSAMESAFIRSGEETLRWWRPEVVHAHDWMVAHAAVELRRASGAPLAATIHATEAGRYRGWVTSELSTAIHAIEWWLANTADAVITCSATMRAEVNALFGVTAERVIPNGIDPAAWTPGAGVVERIRAAHPQHPLVTFTGRLEWEKGVQTLVESAAVLRAAHPDARILVAGRGSYSPSLHELARGLGVTDVVEFLGWVSEEDLRGLIAAADVAVVPSMYEPFGLVALEAAAVGTPVVVAATGGLAEFADDGCLAASFSPGDAAGLATALLADLEDPAAAAARALRARTALAERYAWPDIARRTVEVYSDARAATQPHVGGTVADRVVLRHALGVPHLVAPLGNLLAGGLG